MHKHKIKERLLQYERDKKIVESGNFNFVPFNNFPRLSRYVPGVIPGIMYKVTSHMGVGKTKLSKFLFVYETLFYAMKNNMNFKILYFALEESQEEFIDDLVIHLTKRISKIQVDRFSLTGNSTIPLKEVELQAILSVENALIKVLENIEIIDSKYTPTEILNTCIYYAKKWGKFEQDDFGKDDLLKYTPNDKNQIVLVVADHISLLSQEYDDKSKTFLSKHQSISLWHTDYARRIIAKAWRWAVLNVQQQSLESEKQQFTNTGETVINKILPTLDGLGNNKEVGRDDYVVMGLFAPERYNIEKFMDYHIKNRTPESFGDRFRSLHLLKNRFGHPNKILPLYFDGRYTHFKEMPKPTDLNFKQFVNLLKT